MMFSYKIVIGGLCRDVEMYIAKNLSIVESLGNRFQLYKVLLIENNSLDQTRNVIEMKCKTNPSFQLLPVDNISLQKRTERLAYLRNYLLTHIRNHYSDYDYFLFLDMDDVLQSGKILETINECFLVDSPWDAQFVNCSDSYYDIWALRCQNIITTDCWNDVHIHMLCGKSYTKSVNDCIDTVVSAIKEELKKKSFLPVYSAFGGAGLYKMNTITKTKALYNGLEPSHYNTLICEHVPFHSELWSDGFKLFINRKFLIR